MIESENRSQQLFHQQIHFRHLCHGNTTHMVQIDSFANDCIGKANQRFIKFLAVGDKNTFDLLFSEKAKQFSSRFS